MTTHSHHAKHHTGRNLALALMVVILLGAGGYWAMQNTEVEQWVYDVLSIGGERDIIGTTWSWKRTEFPNGTVIQGPGGDEYLLTFGEDGRLASTTDCNSIFANYTLFGTGIRVGDIASTLKECGPESLGYEYAKELSRASAIDMSTRDLKLSLEDDTGLMVFSRRD